MKKALFIQIFWITIALIGAFFVYVFSIANKGFLLYEIAINYPLLSYSFIFMLFYTLFMLWKDACYDTITTDYFGIIKVREI